MKFIINTDGNNTSHIGCCCPTASLHIYSPKKYKRVRGLKKIFNL